jgi:glycine dehydrogenase
MLVEPTESESKEEIDRFCDAMISIRREAEEVIQGKQPRNNNLLKNAPHPIAVLTEDKWDKPYSREQAVYPVPELKKKKFWTTVTRIDDGESKRVLTLDTLRADF